MFGRAIHEQLRLAQISGEKLAKEFRESMARTLMHSGLQIIPSDHLHDHQIVVSRQVYDAAKHLS